MTDFTKVQQALERRGYTVRTFAAAAEAAAYLDGAIDGKTVGFGGSATLDALGVYDKLAAHNTVIWHWKQEANAARKAAMQTQVYLSSANGLAESGEIVNIDGTGRRSVNNSIQKENILDVSDLTEWPVGHALLLASQSRAQIVKTLPWTGNRQWADALTQAKAKAREEQRKAA